MRILKLLIITLTASVSIHAQAPNWTVDPGSYANNMTVNLEMSGSCSTSGDILALFDETDVIRGVSEFDDGSNEFFIIARSNVSSGETLHFKYYDSESDSVFTLLDQTIQFSNNIIIGAGTPMSVSSPESVEPVAVCQHIDVYLNASGETSIVIDDVDAGSSDNCGVFTRSIDISSFNCADRGIQSVTLTVTDGSQNQSACIAQVTVMDTIKPIIICKNIEVYLDANGSAQITVADVDNNSTDNCTLSALTIGKDQFSCADLGANMVTLTGIDNSDNTSSCMSMVTVIDTIAPTTICKNATLYLDNNGSAQLTLSDVDNGSTDNCVIVSRTLSKEQYSCSDLGSQTVVLTIVDNSGNVSTCETTVTILDTIAPSASCLSPTIYINESGVAVLTIADTDDSSTDNCNVLIKELSQSSFVCNEKGSRDVTLTMRDASGNSSSCTSTVTVLDTIKPIVICKNIEVFLNSNGIAQIEAIDVDNNSIDNCTLYSLTIDKEQFSCADLGANTVTLTGVDNSGNSSSCLAIVTVVDNISPTVSCRNIDVILDANGQATIAPEDINNGSIDNCMISSVRLSKTQYDCTDIGAQSVTMTVTDQSGNATSCVAVVTVIDNTVPTAICKNIDIVLAEDGTATITAADIDNGSTDNCSIVSRAISKTIFEKNEARIQSVVLTVTDITGLQSTCISQVTIINNYENDVINCSDGVDNDNDGLTDCADPDCGKPIITAVDVTTPSSNSCALSNADGQIVISHQGGDLYSIDGGSTTQLTSTFTGITSGTYPVWVQRTETGCAATTSVEVDNVVKLTVTTQDVELLCTDNQGIVLTAGISFNSAPYQYTWQNADNNVVPNNALSSEGTYSVTVVDDNGCSDTGEMTITRGGYTDEVLSPDFIDGMTMLCKGNTSIPYSAQVKDLEGAVNWSYSGRGVEVIPSVSTSHDVVINISQQATPGSMTATFTGRCGSKTATLPISFGSDQTCSIYSNCIESLVLLPTALADSGLPGAVSARTTITAQGGIAGREMMFSAGESIVLRPGFEVGSESGLTATIGPCGEY